MTRRLLAFAAAFILVAGALSGCATERQSQYTATGAGVGAITGGILGGVIGSMSGRTAEGVVIGSILGGLTGAAIGNAEYHQQRSEEEAARYYAYNTEDARRDLLRIESASADPQTAQPGEEVRLSATYTLLGRRGVPREVHEVREVRYEGRLIGRPETYASKGGGTWASSVPVRLPSNAGTGTYVVTTIVETDSAGDTRESTFRVVPGSSWRR